jgi:hypothetical protein
MSEGKDKSLAYNLGAFFGHIVRAAKTDVSAPVRECVDSRVVRTQVGEARLDTSQGPLTLRRTIIDEVRTGPSEGGGAEVAANDDAGREATR